MLVTNYKLKIKEYLQTKPTMFFSLILPLILATLFYLTMTGLGTGRTFESIPIAVENTEVSNTLKNIEVSDNAYLFKIVDSKDYKKDLKSEKISAYISGSKKLKVVVENNNTNSSLVYQTVNMYNHITNMYGKVMSSDLTIDVNEVQKTYNSENNIENKFDSSNKNVVMVYYIALLAMTCLSASNQGVDIGESFNRKSDLESTKRILISPVSKSKIILPQFLAAFTFSIVVSFITVFYLAILKTPIKDYLLPILITMFLGTILGLLQGILVSSLLNVKIATKYSLNASIYVFSSFLAGLMANSIPYQVNSVAPFVKYVNPASVIANTLKQVYFFESTAGFLGGLLNIFAIIVVFVFMILFSYRRKKYENF